MSTDNPKRRSSSDSSGRSGGSRSGRKSGGSRKGSSSSSGGKSKRSLGKKTSKQLGKVTEGIEKGFKAFAEAVSGIVDMIFSVLFPKNLRKKVDKLGKSKKAKRVSKKVGKQVGKLTDNVEKSFKKGASGFFEVFGFLFQIFVPKFVRDRVEKYWKAIGDRTSKFFKRLNKGLSSWAEKYLPPWLLQIIKATSKRLKRTRKNFGKFSAAWFKSRDFITLAWSTPAVLMAVPMGAILALSAAHSVGAKQLHYNRAAMEADREENFALGSLCRQKLNQLGYKQLETAQYIAALEQAKQGNYDAAYALMKQIAKLSPEFWSNLDLAEADDSVADELVPAENIPLEPEADTEEFSDELEDLGVSPNSLGISSAAIEAAQATILPTRGTRPKPIDTSAKETSEPDPDASAEEPIAEGANEELVAEDAVERVAEGVDESELYKDNFMPAHIWIAEHLLEGKIKERTDLRKWKVIEEHAKVANILHMRSLSESMKGRTTMYEDRLGQRTIGLVDAAVLMIAVDQNAGITVMRRMIDLAELHKPYTAQVMRHYHASRSIRRAKENARAFIDYIGYQPERALSDQVRDGRRRVPTQTELVSLIEAYSILGTSNNEIIAEELAQRGSVYYADNSILHGLHALVLRKKMYQLNPYSGDYVDKLIEIHVLQPDNEEIARKLARKLNERNSTYDVDELFDEGRAGVALLLEMGDLAATAGNYPLANKRYNQALERDENSSRALNNKAVITARVLPGDSSSVSQSELERALGYSNDAIDIEPNSTYFETRGQIHAKLREWKKAVEDLVRALNGILSLQDQRTAHETLAEAYGRLGQSDLQKIHAAEAERIRAASGIRTRLGN